MTSKQREEDKLKFKDESVKVEFEKSFVTRMECLMQSNKTDWEKIYENRMETGK